MNYNYLHFLFSACLLNSKWLHLWAWGAAGGLTYLDFGLGLHVLKHLEIALCEQMLNCLQQHRFHHSVLSYSICVLMKTVTWNIILKAAVMLNYFIKLLTVYQVTCRFISFQQ